MDDLKKTFSVTVPLELYLRIERLSSHPRFRSMNQVVLECLRRSFAETEADYPALETETKDSSRGAREPKAAGGPTAS